MSDDGFDEDLSEHFGQATAAMVDAAVADGMRNGVLLMRHSARTFDRSIHDLLNPLTEHGRMLCRQFGDALPKDFALRGFASPPERCLETAEIAIATHEAAGGAGGRTRPVEALGVFYALDQQKMWKGLQAADGLADYVGQWFAGDVPTDAMMPADLAVQMLLRVLGAKLETSSAAAAGTPGATLDLCVTHDMTVYTMRHGVGLESVAGPEVEFLDGLLLFERDGERLMRSQHGGEVRIQ